MFDIESRPTIVKSVVELADYGIKSADSTADSAANPLRIGLWVRALSLQIQSFVLQIQCAILQIQYVILQIQSVRLQI